MHDTSIKPDFILKNTKMRMCTCYSSLFPKLTFSPFQLAPVRLVSSVRELERTYPGPKVVIATDSSLSCGLSKSLLLRWGGDPRCKVIFTDTTELKSLASELRGKNFFEITFIFTFLASAR